MIDLRNSVNSKENSGNENPSKILNIALARVKAGNTSENLLNEIRQIIHFLYRAKENTKKVYDNIMNSIKF